MPSADTAQMFLGYPLSLHWLTSPQRIPSLKSSKATARLTIPASVQAGEEEGTFGLELAVVGAKNFEKRLGE